MVLSKLCFVPRSTKCFWLLVFPKDSSSPDGGHFQTRWFPKLPATGLLAYKKGKQHLSHKWMKNKWINLPNTLKRFNLPVGGSKIKILLLFAYSLEHLKSWIPYSWKIHSRSKGKHLNGSSQYVLNAHFIFKQIFLSFQIWYDLILNIFQLVFLEKIVCRVKNEQPVC